jgi:hypothetical protein
MPKHKQIKDDLINQFVRLKKNERSDSDFDFDIIFERQKNIFHIAFKTFVKGYNLANPSNKLTIEELAVHFYHEEISRYFESGISFNIEKFCANKRSQFYKDMIDDYEIDRRQIRDAANRQA